MLADEWRCEGGGTPPKGRPMQPILDAVLASALTPWALVVMCAFCLVDGFFPPVPSESIVVALAAVYAASDPARLLPLLLLAAAGALVGDNIAYLIGRRLHPLVERRPGLAARVHEASEKIRDRGALLLVPARFIPVGRVFVNVGAGVAEYPHRRFLGITVVSGLVWAGYAIGIGLVAGRWFHDSPLLGAAVGVALGVALGLVIDRVGSAVRARRQAQPA